MERKTNAQKSNVTLKDMICSPKAQLREMICEIDIEQFDAGLTNEIKVFTESDCLPYRKCYHIGRVYQDGVVLSFLDEDVSSASFALLDKIRKSNIKLYEKTHKVVLEDGKDPEEVTDLYVPYVLKNHSSTKPTVFEYKKKNSTSPTYFEIEYEIVFVSDEGHLRYLNPICKLHEDSNYICDVIYYIRQNMELQISTGYDGLSYDERSNTYKVIFFDDIGDEVCYEFRDVEDFFSCIRSIRRVDVEEFTYQVH